MVTGRVGHSLPELIVAMAFLGVTLGGVSAATLLGARHATEAVQRQEAMRVAATLMDSLVMGGAAGERGRLEIGTLRARWIADGTRLLVVVEAATGTPLARLEGRRLPRVPVLPAADSAVEGGP